MIQHLKYLFNWVPGFDPRIIPLLLSQKDANKIKQKKLPIFFGNYDNRFFAEKIYGGKIKLFYLKNSFQETINSKILYLVSSALPAGWIWTLLYFKITGRKVILNQNGVYYPDIFPFFFSLANLANKIIFQFSDYVIYQSKFCKKMALKYLVIKDKKSSIVLYNPAKKFKIPEKLNNQHKNISLMGNQYEKYRIDRALKVSFILKRKKIKFSLHIYGKLNWTPNLTKNKKYLEKEIKQKKLQGIVIYKRMYKREDLPNILRKTDILLHTKNFDPCPSSVVEAIRNGVPVVYIKNGGTPELVGPGGIGVVHAHKKTMFVGKLEEKLCNAICNIIEKNSKFSKLARAQGEKFSVGRWIREHKIIIKKLINEKNN